MTHHYIAFATFKKDWKLVKDLYPQAAGSRVTLQCLKDAPLSDLPPTRLWVDAEIDGLHHHAQLFGPARTDYQKYRNYIEQFQNARRLVDPPDSSLVAGFVKSVLDSVMNAAATLPNLDLGYISVPQLPYIPGASRNKINRILAEQSLKWTSSQRRPPRLILPVVFAKKWGQTDTKTDRKKKVDLAGRCFEASGADGVWIVDSTLDDQAAISTLEKRIQGIIHFHEELNEQLPPDAIKIAGPYWGLNLILWARGLVQFPAIGLGRGFQYLIPGRDPQTGGARMRLAVSSLKRLVVSAALKPWLQHALQAIKKTDFEYDELTRLSNGLDLMTKDKAREQIARFYKDWLFKLESVPPSSRALTLYQDFSAAFVLGSRLEPFDKDIEDVPNPAVIAKQLMVNCL